MDTEKVRELLAKLKAQKEINADLVRQLAEATEEILRQREELQAALRRTPLNRDEKPPK